MRVGKDLSVGNKGNTFDEELQALRKGLVVVL